MTGRLRGRLCLFFCLSLSVGLPFGVAGAPSQRPTSPPSGADRSRAGADVPSSPLDINTASAAELRALPGMGVVYAQRVLDGRPYTAKNQLLTRGVLPPAAYQQIRDRIVAHRPVRSG